MAVAVGACDLALARRDGGAVRGGAVRIQARQLQLLTRGGHLLGGDDEGWWWWWWWGMEGAEAGGSWGPQQRVKMSPGGLGAWSAVQASACKCKWAHLALKGHIKLLGDVEPQQLPDLCLELSQAIRPW